MENLVLQGDCLDRLKEIEADSVDLVCTDPPYGYSFMGKDWDKAVPSIEVWQECLRVLKPGGFAFVMSAPRSDVCSRMSLRLEEAGFKIDFTPIYWTYASGFPKASNIGKMVDKRNGVEFETKPAEGVGFMNIEDDGYHATKNQMIRKGGGKSPLEGSYGGFQPKPAVEVIIVAMKPITEKTYVDQALKNGKGITWLDDARIPTSEVYETKGASKMMEDRPWNDRENTFVSKSHEQGRFPANLLVSDDVLNDGQNTVSKSGDRRGNKSIFQGEGDSEIPRLGITDSGSYSRYFSLDAWWAKTFPFLIVPKASKGEKNKGLEGFEEKQKWLKGGTGTGISDRENVMTKNTHPTVKPLKLMSYLITLGSRKGDIVLDPFAGSGTTLVAAKQLGRNYIGIEREAEYIEIINARLKEKQLQIWN